MSNFTTLKPSLKQVILILIYIVQQNLVYNMLNKLLKINNKALSFSGW